jgi:hypothetical protein
VDEGNSDTTYRPVSSVVMQQDNADLERTESLESGVSKGGGLIFAELVNVATTVGEVGAAFELEHLDQASDGAIPPVRSEEPLNLGSAGGLE